MSRESLPLGVKKIDFLDEILIEDDFFSAIIEEYPELKEFLGLSEDKSKVTHNDKEV